MCLHRFYCLFHIKKEKERDEKNCLRLQKYRCSTIKAAICLASRNAEFSLRPEELKISKQTHKWINKTKLRNENCMTELKELNGKKATKQRRKKKKNRENWRALHLVSRFLCACTSLSDITTTVGVIVALSVCVCNSFNSNSLSRIFQNEF